MAARQRKRAPAHAPKHAARRRRPAEEVAAEEVAAEEVAAEEVAAEPTRRPLARTILGPTAKPAPQPPVEAEREAAAAEPTRRPLARTILGPTAKPAPQPPVEAEPEAAAPERQAGFEREEAPEGQAGFEPEPEPPFEPELAFAPGPVFEPGPATPEPERSLEPGPAFEPGPALEPIWDPVLEPALQLAGGPAIEAPAGAEPVKAEAPPSVKARTLWRNIDHQDRVQVQGGARLRLLVLASTAEDTTAIDLASGALVRLRVPWPSDHRPDLAGFDVVEVTLADDPQSDDLAQPEAATAAELPRQVGTLRGRRVRRLLERLAAPPDGPLLGFPGSSAPYWEFRGARPSVALIVPTRGPQLIRRPRDSSTWVRFGWQRDDVWLPVHDSHAIRSLDAARRERLSGKPLSTALGFAPQYLLAALSLPRDGHCYKICVAILPRG